MVVYYHGHNGSSSIESYINANKYRDFRAKLASTKAVLVEPWAGINPSSARSGPAPA